MIGQDLRELAEDFTLGVFCTATYIQDHAKGWITFGLAAIYGVYKLITQRHEASIKKLERDLLRMQIDKWSELTNADLLKLQENLKKDVQTQSKKPPKA